MCGMLKRGVIPALLAVLMFAGSIKGSPYMDWLPVDLTLAVAALLALFLFFGALHQRSHVRLPLPAIVGLASLLPGAAMSATTDYGTTKLAGLALTMLSICAGFYLTGGRPDVLRRFVLAMICVGLVFTTLAVRGGPSVDDRLSLEGTNTIATGRLAGTAMVLLLTLAMTKTRGRLLLIAAGASLAVPMIQTGSRGPVLAAAIAVMLVALVKPGRGRLSRLALSVAVLAAGWYVLTNISGFGAERIKESITGQITSTGRRDVIWSSALQWSVDHPLGVGFGNFTQVAPTALDTDGSGRFYAHNVLLESFVEGGWMLGLVVLAWIVWVIVKLRPLARDRYVGAILAAVVFSLVNALTSGDINDNRPLWICLAVASAVVLARRSEGDAVVLERGPDRVDSGLHRGRLSLHVGR
jgi:O-antigen ligase